MDRGVSARRRQVIGALAGLALLAGFGVAAAQDLRGTGDLGVVVERASGSLLIVDQSERAAIGHELRPALGARSGSFRE